VSQGAGSGILVGRRTTTPTVPLVSVVTPTLDRRDYLRHTLASVRRQTYPNIEHIVMDGGSTDGTLELLREEERLYRMRWVSGPDDGMYQAINRGLSMAEGDILAYLNSDDLYFPWTVETVVEAFHRHPEASFVYGDILVIEEDTGSTELMWRFPFDLDFLRRTGFLSQPAVFWRRQAFEDVGPFDESLRYVADCDYWMRAGERHRFQKVDEFLAVERSHAGTLREQFGATVWPELRTVRQRYVTLDGPHHEQRMRRHRRRDRFYRYLYLAIVLGQSLVPRAWRRGPWSRLLRSDSLRVERKRLLVRLIPWAGKRIMPTVVTPSRHWLTQAERREPIAR
jgi:glycosyltransferase involved in cell wall biosynthesis